MDARPDECGITQWALRQTSMEEVFLRIARESEADMAARLEADDSVKKSGPCSTYIV